MYEFQEFFHIFWRLLPITGPAFIIESVISFKFCSYNDQDKMIRVGACALIAFAFGLIALAFESLMFSALVTVATFIACVGGLFAGDILAMLYHKYRANHVGMTPRHSAPAGLHLPPDEL